MTKEELAAKLDGTEYPCRVSKELQGLAREHGLVIVYGASDDLMEFAGAIYDEVGACEGTTVLVDTQGLQTTFEDLKLNDEPEERFEDYFHRKGCGREIKAIWDRDGYSWLYETDIPHATFEVIEDGEKYCQGIVFSLGELE